MQLQPRIFWRMTLAEWRAACAGHVRREKDKRRQHAWDVSWLLVAAGCEADKVTPAKLLGEKEPKQKSAKREDKPNIREVWEQFQRLGEERSRRVAEIGEEAVKAEEEAALKKARAKARRKFEREG